MCEVGRGVGLTFFYTVANSLRMSLVECSSKSQ